MKLHVSVLCFGTCLGESLALGPLALRSAAVLTALVVHAVGCVLVVLSRGFVWRLDALALCCVAVLIACFSALCLLCFCQRDPVHDFTT